MDDDVLGILAIVAAGPSEGDEGLHLPERPGVEDMEADPDLLLVAGQAAPGPRRYKQRSWELMQMATAAKKQRRTDAKLETAVLQNKALESQLDAVTLLYPLVAKSLGLAGGRTSADMDEKKAQLVSAVAVRPLLRGADHVRQTQSRSLSLTARAALQLQATHAERILYPGRGVAAPAAAVGPGVLGSEAAEIVAVAWQWDETTQMAKNLLREVNPGERVSCGKVAVQVMMQTGRMLVYDVQTRQVSILEPLLCRPTYVERQTADFLLQGLVSAYPIKIEDDIAMEELLSNGKDVICTFSHDRASQNFVMLRWLFAKLMRNVAGLSPPNIFAHAEPCALHGFQLVRSRPRFGKDVIAANASFTKFVQHWRTSDQWRLEILKVIEGQLEHVMLRRPDVNRTRNGEILRLLFPEETRDSPLFADFQTLASLVAFDTRGFVHHCYVEEGSPSAQLGIAVGSACCRDREDAVRKVCNAVCNLFVGRAWTVAAENRWTHTSTTLKRILSGYLCGNMFATSLNNLRIFWAVDDSLEAALAAQIAEDANNFSAKRKQRLLRLCRVLCRPGVEWQTAVLVTAIDVVDRLMYLTFGKTVAETPTLLSFVGLGSPRLAETQACFLELLANFHAENPGWALVAATGNDFLGASSSVMRRFVRQVLMQLSGSVFDHFDLRWSEPPYSLLPLLEADEVAPRIEKRRRCAAFLSKPDHCLSAFLKQLRRRCPNMRQLLKDSVPLLDAFNANLYLGIDFSERCTWASPPALFGSVVACRISLKVFVSLVV
jgi:hypothetical protein